MISIFRAVGGVSFGPDSRSPDALRRCQQSNWIRTRHERESGAAVAIFVLLYFRAYVIDSISPHHSSFHDKRRGVEVEEQADAKAGCAEIGPHRCDVHVLQGFDGF